MLIYPTIKPSVGIFTRKQLIINFLRGCAYLSFCKNRLWYVDFITLCSVFHYGLCLLHSSLRQQPSRRLWDQPGEGEHCKVTA